jgi:hypothetical protein
VSRPQLKRKSAARLPQIAVFRSDKLRESGKNPSNPCFESDLLRVLGGAFVKGSRTTSLLVAAVGGFLVIQLQRVEAQWWRHGPRDFEECADLADKAASKEERRLALADCNARFAGRRKPGGGYTYYDFLQDRSFDIAGPNPTPEEQKKIDEQYTIYLDNQRRSNIAAAFALKRQEQEEVQQVSLHKEAEKIPVPQQRPKQKAMGNDARARAKELSCVRGSFSCEWPRLSQSWNGLKKLFTSPSTKAKKS